MNSCIFCEIIAGRLDAAEIWHDQEKLHYAYLDINPNVYGMTLVVTKNHYDSDLHDMSEIEYGNFFAAARQVIELLKEKLEVKRVAMVVEGMGVNHAHIKLYPLHGLNKRFEEIWGQDRVYFEKYEGYITTQLGPQVDVAELKKIAQTIMTK